MRRTAAWMVKVFPGEYYVTSKADEMLVTVLGSCVSACIRDPRLGIGGMNHFMLAAGRARRLGRRSQSTRYGNFAMEKLINELLKAGCSRASLEIKVFGGGNVTDTSNAVGIAERRLRAALSQGRGPAMRRPGSRRAAAASHSLFPGDRAGDPASAGRHRNLRRRHAKKSNTPRRLRSQKTAGDIELFG